MSDARNTTGKRKTLVYTIAVAEGVQVGITDGLFVTKGAKGEVKRKLMHHGITAAAADGKIVLTAENPTKREKRMLGTFKAHIQNMMKGCSEGHTYKMKICSGHFPMSVSVSNNQLIIKNFTGEKMPRVLDIKQEVTVKVEGQDVLIESTEKELAGQAAAGIEQLTKRPAFDKRIFQDGIYIVEKDGKPVKK